MDSTKKVQEKILTFFQKYPATVVQRHATFLYGGEQPAGVYFLEEGHIRQYDISARSGNEFTLHIYNPNSFFPLTWALNNTPNRYFFQAVTESTVRIAPREDVIAFLKKEGDVLFSVAQRLGAGLNGLTFRMEYQVFGDAYVRILAELLYLGRHFGTRRGKRLRLEEQFTHQNLADLSGSVRETVSVAMEKLKANHLITYEDHLITITDVAALEAELDRLL